MNTSNNLRELTLRGMLIGAIITVIFTASNVYLGLKVGLTFSSAIPAAVISMAILRLFSGSTILENNAIQTQASAAGTLSSIIFILPGLIMIGYWNHFPFWHTMLICTAGGMLGVIFSIPFRHVMVVKSNLPYPEGVAAAEILKAGCGENEEDANSDDTKSNLKDILFGGVIASMISFATNGLRVLSDSASIWLSQGKAIFQLPMGFSVALLSAGYLIGISAGIAMLIGIFLGWGIIVPYISSMMDYSADLPLHDVAMSIWAKDVRFIGAGAIAIAAIWTLIILLKPVIEGLRTAFRAFGNKELANSIPRTERDLSPRMMIGTTIAMLLILVFTFHSFISESSLETSTGWILVGFAVLAAFTIGFLVAAACGYMAGLVGSSSSPISGIGIIAIIIISVLLITVTESIGLDSTDETKKFITALAIFTTAAVMAVATISNDNLQDLKTGYLVKATPASQQIALLIGCVVGAAVIAPVLDLLYNAYGFTGAVPRPDMDPKQVLSAPQATLMTTIVQGIVTHNLNWTMLIIGIIIGAVVIVIDLILKAKTKSIRIPALAVGMGIYLPPSINIPLVLGSVLSWFIHKQVKKRTAKSGADTDAEWRRVDRRATLVASGLIVGESLVGVALAIMIVFSISNGGSDAPLAITNLLTPIFGAQTETATEVFGLIVFASVCLIFVKRALSALNRK